jgi:hypothetical protein
MVRRTIWQQDCCVAQDGAAGSEVTMMFKRLIRWISEAFAQGFQIVGKLPPQALRHANYPF